LDAGLIRKGERNMSAAATAAGYLYASGRLRGRGTREAEVAEHGEKKELTVKRREPRIAVYEPEAAPRPEKPKRVPKVEYRVRRWKPGE
jgi:hypothetical protein